MLKVSTFSSIGVKSKPVAKGVQTPQQPNFDSSQTFMLATHWPKDNFQLGVQHSISAFKVDPNSQVNDRTNFLWSSPGEEKFVVVFHLANFSFVPPHVECKKSCYGTFILYCLKLEEIPQFHMHVSVAEGIESQPTDQKVLSSSPSEVFFLACFICINF